MPVPRKSSFLMMMTKTLLMSTRRITNAMETFFFGPFVTQGKSLACAVHVSGTQDALLAGLIFIYLCNNKIETKMEGFSDQYTRLRDFINSYDHQLIKLEYIEPYGNSIGVDIYVERFVLEITFKPSEDVKQNEIRSKFFLNVNGFFKPFVLKKEFSQNGFENLKRFRRDYYIQSVTLSNWADTIIDAIKAVENETEKFLQICEQSCPFNKDGTHKYKSWKTFAKVEVSFVENTELVQGIKKDEFVAGSHVVGSNGSFRYWDKRTYVLKYTVDRLACEKPLKFTKEVDVDVSALRAGHHDHFHRGPVHLCRRRKRPMGGGRAGVRHESRPAGSQSPGSPGRRRQNGRDRRGHGA